MKILAETTGDFMLHDLSTGDSIQASRPSVVTRSGFIDARIGINQILWLADVPNDATDDEFAEYWATSDNDRDLAVASFTSKFEAEVTTTPKKRGK